MTPWEENLTRFPELEEIKKWLAAGNKNEFYDSIVNQATKRKLSDRQIESAQRSFEKIKNPPKRVTFDDLEVQAYTRILVWLADISPMGGEFYRSIEVQIKNKKQLSEKQWESVTKKMYRFRKSLLRKCFTGQTKKQ